MKKLKYPIIVLCLLIVSYAVIQYIPKSLNSRLDDLEAIIERYEPVFANTPYGTQQYTDMINEYNREIFAWAEEFEMQRYQRDDNNKMLFDKDNKPKVNPEFSGDVEKRFYALNNRMTEMVLSNIPPKKMKNNEE